MKCNEKPITNRKKSWFSRQKVAPCGITQQLDIHDLSLYGVVLPRTLTSSALGPKKYGTIHQVSIELQKRVT